MEPGSNAARSEGAPPGDDLVADEVVAHALDQVRALAQENEELRRQQAEQREVYIGQLEANRELQWRLDGTSDSAAGGTEGASTRDWHDVDGKLQLLLTENNLLEARERQASEELQAQQEATRKLQLALSEAQAAAERAIFERAEAEDKRKVDFERAELASERERDAHRLGAASTGAIANLQRELEAARQESRSAHEQAAAMRHEAEKAHARSAAAIAEAAQREQVAEGARADMMVQLEEYKQRVRDFEADWAGTDRAVKQQLSAAEQVRNELVVNQDAVRRLEASLAEEREALEASAGRESQLTGEVKSLTHRLEQMALLLSRQDAAMRKAAHEHGQSAALQLEEARQAAALVVEQAAEKELAHAKALEMVNSQLERELRERRSLQSQLEEAQTKVITLTAEKAQVAALGDAPLRAEMTAHMKRADEAEQQVDTLRTEVRTANEEIVRQRVRAENADGEAQRSEILARRAASQAEAERDAMALRMAQRVEAADAALADAAQMESRIRAENESFRKFCEADASQLRLQNGALTEQLDDVMQGAAQLQELLSAQQQLAEAYRHEARQALERLSQFEVMPTYGANPGLAIQRLRTQMDSQDLRGAQSMLEESRGELSGGRDTVEEEQRPHPRGAVVRHVIAAPGDAPAISPAWPALAGRSGWHGWGLRRGRFISLCGPSSRSVSHFGSPPSARLLLLGSLAPQTRRARSGIRVIPRCSRYPLVIHQFAVSPLVDRPRLV